ncbi:O-antigen ligase family protein [Qipengyuania sp. SS22]|uniref:O-antigen ligase family protein n=1 Tax=Qipengyuania sp. SS22 TaxID=2979461 RepID=UPI0021E5B950|nr:O-antigen ligase family protein [Qipengyuania sp. SS22]UYH56078.1 O-antigen ligase family protein [Qipengyuania sp. SS22]
MAGMTLRMAGAGEREGQLKTSDQDVSRGWILLGLLATTVAFTGGASRFDAIQILPLRTLSAIFLVLSLFFLTKERLKAERSLVVLFGSFALIVALQLVPLPPLLWQSFPQRLEVSQLDAVLGQEGVWRPLTLAPVRTWNVLGSLVVPAAGLFSAIALRASSLILLQIVVALGVLNALLGLLQIAIGKSSILYFYEVTNSSSPVGILANENHAAIFAACSMLVVTLLGLRVRQGSNASWERLVYVVAFFFILFVALVGRSRAGFIAAIGASLVSITMIVLSSRHREGGRASTVVQRALDGRPAILLAIPVVIVTLTAASFLALDRAPAFRDILARDNLEDLRWSLWPVLAKMLENHLLLGTGFGSFEQVYNIYEPSALLMSSYVNQAHDDWAQFVIEGGALAGVLLMGLLAWLVKRVAVMASHQNFRIDAVFWVSVFTLIGAASLIDYPLRTPLFQLVTVWLLLALSRDARGEKIK